jgi:hypothetical protein
MASLIFVGCWAAPGSAFCALAFYDGFVPGQPLATGPTWMDGPVGGVLTMLAVVYGFFWLCLPVVLLAVGIGELVATARPGWRWPSLWAAVVGAGIALDALGLWAVSTTYSGGGFEWQWLAASIGYLAVGAALAAILITAPRPALSDRQYSPAS